MANTQFANRAFAASLLLTLLASIYGYSIEHLDGSWIWLLLLGLSLLGMVFYYSKLYPVLWGGFIGSLTGMFSCEVCSNLNFNLQHLLVTVAVALGAFAVYLLFQALGIRFK